MLQCKYQISTVKYSDRILIESQLSWHSRLSTQSIPPIKHLIGSGSPEHTYKCAAAARTAGDLISKDPFKLRESEHESELFL